MTTWNKDEKRASDSPTVTLSDALDLTIIAAVIIAIILFASVNAHSQTLPDAPKPVNDGYGFHRSEDVLFGAMISAPVGMASKPWIGLAAASAAGVANEARYGSHFSVSHLAFIEAGALAGWELARISHRIEARHRKNQPTWIGN